MSFVVQLLLCMCKKQSIYEQLGNIKELFSVYRPNVSDTQWARQRRSNDIVQELEGTTGVNKLWWAKVSAGGVWGEGGGCLGLGGVSGPGSKVLGAGCRRRPLYPPHAPFIDQPLGRPAIPNARSVAPVAGLYG